MSSNSNHGGSGGSHKKDAEITTEEFPRPEGYLPKDKFNLPKHQALERYGKTMQPIPCTSAYRATIRNFSQKSILPETWVLVNDEAGTYTFVNTFDGMTKSGFDAETATFQMNPKRLAEKLKGKVEVPIDECPIAVSLADAKKHKTEAPSAELHPGEPSPNEESHEVATGAKA